jgi:ankyrin repeat protein
VKIFNLKLRGKFIMHLIQAILDNDLHKLTALLLEGLNPNAAEDQGSFTPLHYAASEGLFEAAFLLLTAGAKSLQKNACGVTPLDIARLYKHSRLVQLFLRFNSHNLNTDH